MAQIDTTWSRMEIYIARLGPGCAELANLSALMGDWRDGVGGGYLGFRPYTPCCRERHRTWGAAAPHLRSGSKIAIPGESLRAEFAAHVRKSGATRRILWVTVATEGGLLLGSLLIGCGDSGKREVPRRQDYWRAGGCLGGGCGRICVLVCSRRLQSTRAWKELRKRALFLVGAPPYYVGNLFFCDLRTPSPRTGARRRSLLRPTSLDTTVPNVLELAGIPERRPFFGGETKLERPTTLNTAAYDGKAVGPGPHRSAQEQTAGISRCTTCCAAVFSGRGIDSFGAAS